MFFLWLAVSVLIVACLLTSERERVLVHENFLCEFNVFQCVQYSNYNTRRMYMYVHGNIDTAINKPKLIVYICIIMHVHVCVWSLRYMHMYIHILYTCTYMCCTCTYMYMAVSGIYIFLYTCTYMCCTCTYMYMTVSGIHVQLDTYAYMYLTCTCSSVM